MEIEKIMNRYTVLFFMCFITVNTYGADTWTWLYQKIFSEKECLAAHDQPTIFFCKEDVSPFTQLIFSSNAYRPDKGFFSYWVQVRDAKNHSWGMWHKMIDWGKEIQCSYESKGDFTSYHHVRLETGKHYADAFRIKIVAREGAYLSSLRAIFVSLSDMISYKAEVPDRYCSVIDDSVFIPNVPKKSQLVVDHPHNHSLCSPTSCSVMLGYLLNEDINIAEFADLSFDRGLNTHGSWFFNMAHAFERARGNFLCATTRLNSFYNLYQHLKKGIPVVVSVRGYLKGAPKVYDKGHLLTVVGFDAETQHVMCHDSAFSKNKEVYISYPLNNFLSAWEKSHRLAYIVHPMPNKLLV